VNANQVTWPVGRMCRLLEVSASGFYAWKARSMSTHEREDVKLSAKIEAIHRHSYGTYGSPRVHAELHSLGVGVGRKRVARLMKAHGLRGASRRRFIKTTQRDFQAESAPDLVQRQFAADAPNKLWVADITYIPTWEGFLFLAIVLDAFSRRVVGWAMADHLRTELVLAALKMAITQRDSQDVIHHSDHGCQYTSIEFGRRCRDWGVRPSMGSVGDCFDNAMAESFFASLECECLDRHRFKTKSEAEREVFQYIEGFYNPHRRHSSIGYLSPREFERRYAQAH
jgi:transposase InsO family protein